MRAGNLGALSIIDQPFDQRRELPAVEWLPDVIVASSLDRAAQIIARRASGKRDDPDALPSAFLAQMLGHRDALFFALGPQVHQHQAFALRILSDPTAH